MITPWTFRIACTIAVTTALAASLPATSLAQEPVRTLPSDIDPGHPLVPALKLAYRSLEAAEQVEDYEATFSKRERVNGRLIHQVMQMKFREEPHSVYMRFIRPHSGREVIYVEGENRNQLLAHETGLKSIVGTVSLSPTSREAMAENRHPITRVGFKKMLIGIIEQWETEAKYGETEVKFYPNARVDTYECEVIEVKHPQPRKQFKFAVSRLFIDKESKLPVRLEQWGFPPRGGNQPLLEEEYTYTNLRTNVGLTDRDFDVRNPDYGF